MNFFITKIVMSERNKIIRQKKLFASVKCLFVVCNRRDIIKHQMKTNYGTLLHSSMLTTKNTTLYQGGHPIKGVRPSLYTVVFLTPRQVL